MDASDSKAAELAEIVRQIRERVRAAHPEGSAAGMALPELMPVLHARDAALGKVAAIGTVNPRGGGPLNALIQEIKKLIARTLGWYVRDQVEFNRAILRCAEATLEVHDETNRALAELARRTEHLQAEHRSIQNLGSEWQNSRTAWDSKVTKLESEHLRQTLEIQQVFQQRANEVQAAVREAQTVTRDSIAAHQREVAALLQTTEANTRQAISAQHAGFQQSLENASTEIQTKLWKDLRKVQFDYESIIHHELRLIRQRASLAKPTVVDAAHQTAQGPQAAPAIDWLLFAQKFRGSAESIKRSFERYVPKFRDCAGVLDLGCGRGEFLELMHEANVSAKGIDLSEENIALCRNSGLDAERADIFEYLSGLPDGSVGGIFCAQVIEHLQPAQVFELTRLCASKLRAGAPVIFETPNPECLAIFATHFYLDPTHVRPVPPALMAFYLEEAGLGQIEVTRLSPAAETMPSVEKLPDEFRHEFFDGLDYAISARRVL